MKRCPRCKAEKPPEAFTKDKHSADNLSFYCRPCSKVIRERYKARLNQPPPKVRTPAAPLPTVVRPVAADADFLADLDEALLEDQTLRGRESAFERIQLHLYGQ